MTKKAIRVGDTFFRWTVLAPGCAGKNGEPRWLCRCACGTEREVLARGLLYGGSQSCGCLARERSAERNALDLSGRVFGRLTVLGRTKTQRGGGVRWACRCACGNLAEYSATLLASGRRTHCGCMAVRKAAFVDITGRRFGSLTAVRRLDHADAYGSALWHCRCDCGGEVDFSYNNLVYSGVKSCGCKKREHELSLGEFLTHIEGTSVDMLRSKKLPRNNTTGVRGVYRIRGKYVAKIVFQKKQYLLGSYNRLEDAAAARLEAEKEINDRVVAHYERWKTRADGDPAWAQANPIRITIDRGTGGRLRLTVLPEMDEG